jgi:hypothetical protein
MLDLDSIFCFGRLREVSIGFVLDDLYLEQDAPAMII